MINKWINFWIEYLFIESQFDKLVKGSRLKIGSLWVHYHHRHKATWVTYFQFCLYYQMIIYLEPCKRVLAKVLLFLYLSFNSNIISHYLISSLAFRWRVEVKPFLPRTLIFVFILLFCFNKKKKSNSTEQRGYIC